MSRQRRWDFLVAGYYNDTVKPPKQPGALACEVGVLGESARDIEVRAFESRDDIGDIRVLDLRRPDGPVGS
jgi:hypothetical protein